MNDSVQDGVKKDNTKYSRPLYVINSKDPIRVGCKRVYHILKYGVTPLCGNNVKNAVIMGAIPQMRVPCSKCDKIVKGKR